MLKSLGLTKAEIISHKKELDLLFTRGKKIRSGALSAHFLKSQGETEPAVKVFFSVPKKIQRRAVKRNLLKRRMREAYRVNKSEVISADLKADGVMIGFVYTSNKVESFQIIENAMVIALRKINNKLTDL